MSAIPPAIYLLNSRTILFSRLNFCFGGCSLSIFEGGRHSACKDRFRVCPPFMLDGWRTFGVRSEPVVGHIDIIFLIFKIEGHKLVFTSPVYDLLRRINHFLSHLERPDMYSASRPSPQRSSGVLLHAYVAEAPDDFPPKLLALKSSLQTKR